MDTPTQVGGTNPKRLIECILAGSWRGRRASGTEYVDALRGGDLNERLGSRPQRRFRRRPASSPTQRDARRWPAAQRRGHLGDEHARALAVFEELQEDLITVGVDSDLARRAGEHAEDLGLRGYDAVHLATALELGDEEAVLVTWDRDLARASKQAGLGLAGLS